MNFGVSRYVTKVMLTCKWDSSPEMSKPSEMLKLLKMLNDIIDLSGEQINDP